MTKKILVLGIGTEILKDDGIGPRIINELKDKPEFSGITFANLSLGGLDILEFIQGYDVVIFVDAIKTAGGVPGTVYSYQLSDFKETLHLTNLHDVSFLTAIKLGEQIGYKIPKRIEIKAIEIVEDRVFGEEFTWQLKEKFTSILKEIEIEIKSVIAEEQAIKAENL